MKRILNYLGVALTLTALSFFVWRMRESASDLPTLSFGRAGVAAIGTLWALQVAVLALSALAWRAILTFVGDNSLSKSRSISILFRSQLAKYVPGNVAHHISRVLLAKKFGVSAKRLTLSLAIETLWAVGCAAALSTYTLASLLDGHATNLPFLSNPAFMAIVAGSALLGPVVVFPWIARRLADWLPSTAAPSLVVRFSLPSALGCVGSYLLSFVFYALAANTIAVVILKLPALDLVFLTSVSALAWVAGYITPGSPAGIGIRDTVLLLALQPHYGAEAAGTLAILHRLLTASGDAVVYICGVVIERWALSRE